ncbi:MAG: ImmA/IrrE family metallo-endopeptidase [Muribaculaceae bacterium]|jgi:hypothetical protein|nr:ImmA/IrrE family metallo-endopeptidase [Muribaculaceae bacterium]
MDKQERGIAQDIQDLFENAKKYRNSRDFTNLLNVLARYKGYSVFNLLLMYVQKPDFQMPLPRERWEKQFHRKIKSDACPLVILQPFAPVMFVYDVDNTYSDAIEDYDDALQKALDELEQPYKATGKDIDDKYRHIINNLQYFGITFGTFRAGASNGAFIRQSENHEITKVTINSRQPFRILWNMPFEIKVNDSQDEPTRLASIAHELGHFFCGHLAYKDWWDFYSYNQSHKVKEFEAETVSYLVCTRLGMQTTAERYIASFIDDDGNIPEINISAVALAVNEVEQMMRNLSYKNGYLYKKDFAFKSNVDSELSKRPKSTRGIGGYRVFTKL